MIRNRSARPEAADDRDIPCVTLSSPDYRLNGFPIPIRIVTQVMDNSATRTSGRELPTSGQEVNKAPKRVSGGGAAN